MTDDKVCYTHHTAYRCVDCYLAGSDLTLITEKLDSLRHRRHQLEELPSDILDLPPTEIPE